MAPMIVTNYRVSDRGQMALPAETRRRWGLTDGGAVEIADLGNALVIVPAGRGGLRSIVQAAVNDAGGYESLIAAVTEEEPELV
jgi:AbrB family looped-hinge helix DNA binding protein